MPDDSMPGPRTILEPTLDRTPSAGGSESAPDPGPRGGTFVQNSEEQARAAAASAVPEVVPGYEVLGGLGAGGMGVVYKARQVKLNRVVALKMVLGGRVGRAELIRFLAEAEAIAAVRHPNVVQVYEYGEHDGQPYMALEYLPGGTLDLKPAAGEDRSSSSSFRGVATKLGQVARGVAAAHALGIVHRDLKPGNVLLDEAGSPKVTDFGLAKRAGGTDLTAADAVMGTPPYMSPEQADGKTKFVGPPADVWALGVILYEALTGVRPFQADDKRGVLSQVLAAAPVPPRKRVPSVPRDLELICRTCLAKAAHERYLTAKELADDLEAFAAGRPIRVRPAGPVERGYKWVRRNKVVSGAVAAAALALVTGAAVSVAFGVDAVRERNAAVAARNDLATANTDLGKANADLGGALAREQKANDDLTGALARALRGPLGLGRDGPFTPFEADILWELSAGRGRAVNLRFLEEAVRTPNSCRQIAPRAEVALHAAVGLDPGVRDRAEQLLRDRLAAPGAPPERLTLALLCSRLESLSPGVAAAAAAALPEPLGKATDPAVRWELQTALAALTRRMDPAEAGRVLAAVLPGLKDTVALGTLGSALGETAGRMAPADAARVCDPAARALLAGLRKPTDQMHLNRLVFGLVALAPYLGEETGGDVVEGLAEVMGKGGTGLVTDALRHGLAAVGPRLTPERAAAVARAAASTLAAARLSGGSYLVEVLRAVAPRLTPNDAAAVARILDDGLPSAADSGLLPAVTALAGSPGWGVDPVAAARIYAVGKLPPHYAAADELLQGLGAVAGRMDPEAAARACGAAVRKTDGAFRWNLDRYVRPPGQGLAAVAGYLDPAAATRALAANLARADGYAGELVAALRRVAPGADPGTAEEAARVLSAVLAAPPRDGGRALGRLAEGVAAVAGRMAPAAADRECRAAARVLAAALIGPRHPAGPRELAEGLRAVTAWMPAADAALLRSAAGDVLAARLTQATAADGAGDLAAGWAAVAPAPDPEVAAAIARNLVVLLTKPRYAYSDGGRSAAAALAVVAPHLTPGAAAAAAAVLTDALTRVPGRNELGPTKEPARVLGPLAEGLAALAGRMRPGDAARVCEAAARVLIDPPAEGTDRGRPEDLGRGLRAVLLVASAADRDRARAATVLALGAVGGPPGPVPGLPLLHPHLRPQPRPLPPPVLVDLLKHPFCVGDARRAVLDALEVTYDRRFADQWEFVRFVRDNNLPLDLLTPPARPDPAP